MILLPYRTARRIAWTPRALFAAGEDGFWLDPSDLSTLWQDTSGTTPAAVGDPVGRIDDKSGNGNNAIQGTAANRPILRQDADGAYYLEFDGSNDRLVVTNAMGTQVFACVPMLVTGGGVKVFYDGITSGHRMSLFRDGNFYYAMLKSGPVSVPLNALVGATKENTMAQFDGTSSRFDSMNASVSGVAFSTTDSPTGVTIGSAFDGTFAGALRVYGAIFVCRVATSGERSSANAWVNENWIKVTSHRLVVCDGNSITSGIGAGNHSQNYPSQLAALIGSGYRVVNFGIPSQTTSNMTADAVAQVDPLVNWSGGADLVAWENTNDIEFGASLATCQSRWNAYFSARQAAGWGSNGTRLVAMTTIARGPFSAGQDAILADFNTWLRANYSTYATHLVDLAADSRLSDPTNTTYYNADQIHLNTTGYGVVAELVKAALYP